MLSNRVVHPLSHSVYFVFVLRKLLLHISSFNFLHFNLMRHSLFVKFKFKCVNSE